MLIQGKIIQIVCIIVERTRTLVVGAKNAYTRIWEILKSVSQLLIRND